MHVCSKTQAPFSINAQDFSRISPSLGPTKLSGIRAQIGLRQHRHYIFSSSLSSENDALKLLQKDISQALGDLFRSGIRTDYSKPTGTF
ncbi:hypothetical protein T265_00152 [Opisthorchis viverrini]|uniref:Uncharacterized protein n=1 Tax=Opisthorchis viverrini TaxID=6198 RepID=A0A075A3Q7_OPIVI|nr:hypothetical protein T265_00152 [Opisthorchis viverrini]KER34308.1 hypothetical protein T265_00152 [Opisthorchis viverrini]